MPRNKFLKSIAYLSSATVLAQAIPFFISPILTRLYSPESFGLFGSITAIIGITTVVATFRYELAILMPHDDRDAAYLLYVALCAAILVSIFTSIILIYMPSLLGLTTSNIYIRLVIPFGVVLSSAVITLNYLANRFKQYEQMSFAKILNSVNVAWSQLLIGATSITITKFGLVLGQLIGQTLGLLYLTFALRKFTFPVINIAEMHGVAWKYKHMPIYVLPGQLMNTISANLPIFYLGSLYGLEMLGLFVLAYKVLSLPVSMLANAVGDVYRQEASEAFNSFGRCRPLFLKVFLGLLISSIVPFYVVWLYGEPIVTFLFGEEWQFAGTLVTIMVIRSWAQFVISPLSSTIILSGRAKYDTIWQLFLFLILLALFEISGDINDVEILLLQFSLAYSFMYAVNFLLAFYSSGGRLD